MAPGNATPVTRARTVHVEHCMGTVFSIDIRDRGAWGDAIAEVVRWLHHVDRVFSTYRVDSDVSRMRRGELAVTDAHAEVARVLDLCAELQAETRSWFSARYDGRLDPTGPGQGLGRRARQPDAEGLRRPQPRRERRWRYAVGRRGRTGTGVDRRHR